MSFEQNWQQQLLDIQSHASLTSFLPIAPSVLIIYQKVLLSISKK